MRSQEENPPPKFDVDPYLIMFQVDGKLYMLYDRDALVGYSTAEGALAAISRPYQQSHSRSPEASASACLHSIWFQPRVVQSNLEQVRAGVILEGAHVYDCSSLAGIMTGVRCEGPEAQVLYDSGTPAKLI